MAKITAEQTWRARRMKQGRTSWKTIAEYLGVAEGDLIRRCDRLLARTNGMSAPGWLYGYKSPRKRNERSS